MKRLLENNYIDEKPDQIIINRYLPGEGISAHIDVPHLFKNKIYILSLGSACELVYSKGNDIKKFYVKPRSVLIMQDDARYKYKHEIKPFKYDIIDNKVKQRTTRYSITCRNVIL